MLTRANNTPPHRRTRLPLHLHHHPISHVGTPLAELTEVDSRRFDRRLFQRVRPHWLPNRGQFGLVFRPGRHLNSYIRNGLLLQSHWSHVLLCRFILASHIREDKLLLAWSYLWVLFLEALPTQRSLRFSQTNILQFFESFLSILIYIIVVSHYWRGFHGYLFQFFGWKGKISYF